VRHVCQTTICGLDNIPERREDEVLNADILGYIGDIFTLADFDLRVRRLSEVGDEENCMGVLQCSLEALF
jgi:hypothetical protein